MSDSAVATVNHAVKCDILFLAFTICKTVNKYCYKYFILTIQ